MLVTYVPRIVWTMLRTLPKSRIPLLGEARLPLRIWPFDVDVNLHANNGKYGTLMDFGRWQHVQQTGLLTLLVKSEFKPVLGGVTISYRRELKTLQGFELTSRLACWDEKWWVYEHRFECDGALHALAYVMGVFKNGRKTVPPQDVFAQIDGKARSPVPSPELAQWIAAQKGWRGEIASPEPEADTE